MTTPSKAVSGAAAAAAAPGNRILYDDAIESFAIFLVVAVHSVWLNGNIPASISMSLSPAAVPLFFMVHGALLLGRPDSPRKHLRRSLRVVFQLLAWSVIYLMISLLFSWNKQPLTPRSLYKHYMHAGILNGTMGLGGSLWFNSRRAAGILSPPLNPIRFRCGGGFSFVCEIFRRRRFPPVDSSPPLIFFFLIRPNQCLIYSVSRHFSTTLTLSGSA